MYLAKIYITLKPTVNDPQGLTIKGALHKYIELKIEEKDSAVARTLVDDICRKLLANPVIETYRFDLDKV
jgi:phosphoribosylformylglycinamidine synthase PurS subunit